MPIHVRSAVANGRLLVCFLNNQVVLLVQHGGPMQHVNLLRVIEPLSSKPQKMPDIQRTSMILTKRFLHLEPCRPLSQILCPVRD